MDKSNHLLLRWLIFPRSFGKTAVTYLWMLLSCAHEDTLIINRLSLAVVIKLLPGEGDNESCCPVGHGEDRGQEGQQPRQQAADCPV